jgi:hypothetical protein
VVDGYISDEDDFALTFDIEKDWKVNASVVRIQGENVGLRLITMKRLHMQRKN